MLRVIEPAVSALFGISVKTAGNKRYVI